MKKVYTIICVFVFLFLSISYSQSFSASVSSSNVEQNERFQIDFTFNSNDINGLEAFQPPSFGGLKILSGPNQSTSMQIINGAVSSSITYSYILVGDAVGKFNIGSANIKYKGKSYQSNAVSVNITKADPNKKKTEASQQGVSSEEIAKNVFIRAIPDKNRAFVGEQITVTYKLYTRLPIATPQIQKLPQFQGFWSEELKINNVINFTVEMYQGERFNVATIKKAALFPTKSGKLDVTPFELVIPVQVKTKKRTNDPFEEFFGDSFFGRAQTIEHLAKSNKITIDVSSLPDNNVPVSFTGIVGNYNLTSEINKTETKVNDAITLKYILDGKGNIKLVNIPELKIPAGFEKYEPKITETINSTDVVSGKKVIEYLLVPRTQGTKKIPSIEFTYFNVAQKRYVTERTPEYTINIKPGDGTMANIPSGFSKESVELLNQDIRFIKTSKYNLTSIKEQEFIGKWFWSLLVIIVISFMLFVIYQEKNKKVSSDVNLLKFKKAEKIARTRVKKAEEALNKNDKAQYFDELSLALTGYIEDKLRIDRADFTLEKVQNELVKNNVSADIVERLKQIFEICEMARFSPASSSMQANQQLLNDTINLIVKIDSALKTK